MQQAACSIPACGIIFLDKPSGWTSRKAVNEVVRLFSEKGKTRLKAGHAGTLDPLATGMLPILMGEATRFSGIGIEADKCYCVTLNLTYQTDTLDAEGEVVSRYDVLPELPAIEDVLSHFHGDIEQQPPAYSAIHVDGKRAHEIMREGGEVELPHRPVTVHELTLLSFISPLLTLDVHCSKGTYIRSLARDIGEELGVGGCVTALRRTSTAGWPEVMMVSMDQLAADPYACLLPLEQWLRHLPPLYLPYGEARRYAHGQRIQLEQTLAQGGEGEVAVFCRVDDSTGSSPTANQLLGTGEIRPGLHRMVLHPVRVLPSALARLGSA